MCNNLPGLHSWSALLTVCGYAGITGNFAKCGGSFGNPGVRIDGCRDYGDILSRHSDMSSFPMSSDGQLLSFPESSFAVWSGLATV